MSTNTKRTSLLLLLFSLHLSFWGQNRGDGNKQYLCDSICISLNFRFNDAVVLSDYRGNALSLAQFDTLFDADNLHRIEQITIYGSSSPDDTVSVRRIEEQSIEKPVVDTPALTDSIERKTPEEEKAVNAPPPFDNRIVVRRPLFAVKTNLLFDLATVLNIEVEVPIGKRWSVAGEWIFPWWLWEKKQHCLQVLSGNLEGRYWFGDRSGHKVLTGWFGGLYAGGGLYDLEWDAKGFQGEFFIAMGVSAGYAHSIGRNLSMEYSLGIGYMKTDYRKYDARFGKDEQWHLIRQSNGRFSWFGPTRAKVSLVWTPQFKFYTKGGATR